MKALMRRAMGYSPLPERCRAPAVRESLVAALVARVTTKRTYAELFESPEAAESAALSWGLSEPERVRPGLRGSSASWRARAGMVNLRIHAPVSLISYRFCFYECKR